MFHQFMMEIIIQMWSLWTSDLKKHVAFVQEGNRQFKFEDYIQFFQKRDLNRHVASVHEGNKPFKVLRHFYLWSWTLIWHLGWKNFALVDPSTTQTELSHSRLRSMSTKKRFSPQTFDFEVCALACFSLAHLIRYFKPKRELEKK